jgi:hypothetical protein
MPDPETTDYQPALVRLRVRRLDVIQAAKRFDACMAEFEGDLSACHEYMDALFVSVEKLRTEEEALNV